MSDIFRKGYKLFADNWNTSEKLFRQLWENATNKCGTTGANWLQLPQPFKKEPMQKGQHQFLRDEQPDKKDIYFLSTIHMMEEVQLENWVKKED